MPTNYRKRMAVLAIILAVVALLSVLGIIAWLHSGPPTMTVKNQTKTPIHVVLELLDQPENPLGVTNRSLDLQPGGAEKMPIQQRGSLAFKATATGAGLSEAHWSGMVKEDRDVTLVVFPPGRIAIWISK